MHEYICLVCYNFVYLVWCNCGVWLTLLSTLFTDMLFSSIFVQLISYYTVVDDRSTLDCLGVVKVEIPNRVWNRVFLMLMHVTPQFIFIFFFLVSVSSWLLLSLNDVSQATASGCTVYFGLLCMSFDRVGSSHHQALFWR